LPNNWSLDQRSEFDLAVLKKVRQQANNEWKNSMRAKNLNMPPNLTWKKFQLEPDIQNKLQAEMDELYVKPMLADWNDTSFKKFVVDVNIKRKTKEYLNVLEAQKAEFADGGAFESTGKSALRAIIVPPISMSISLLLVLLTVLKLPLKVIELVKAKRAVKSDPAVVQKKHVKTAV
jgi:hypothetical protein